MTKTTTDRAFEILDLINEGRATVSPDEIAATLGLTRSTTYRYIKTLCGIGLLMQIARGVYSLGPRIVELERKIQISDPLLAAGRRIMPDHAHKVPGSVLILCSLWGDRVLCLRQENAMDADGAGPRLTRARGMPFPLFKGAASLAILANLPPARIKSLYLNNAQEIGAAGLGLNWTEFRAAMQSMRKAGYCLTSGTFETDLTAVAAPILSDEDTVIGSLTRILPTGRAGDMPALISGIREAAADFTASLNAQVADRLDPGTLEAGHGSDALIRSLLTGAVGE